jgi:membrane-associated phospholipid phosphatase
VPFLILVFVSVIAGLAGAYVVSRAPFGALATEGATGFSVVVALKATARRDGIKEWLAACRHRTAAAGLAFCAAIAVFTLGWLCVGLLALLVRESPALLEVDSSVAAWAYVNASPLSLQATLGVTLLGDTIVVGGLALVLGTVDWLRRHDGRILLFLAAIVVGDALITIAVKLLMDRARPTFNPITELLGPSFPSGHASMAAAFYAAAAFLLVQGRSRAATAAIGGAAVAIAVAVAASRVFLDVHWLSDVVAGLAFGWGWFAFCVLAVSTGRPWVAGSAVALKTGGGLP